MVEEILLISSVIHEHFEDVVSDNQFRADSDAVAEGLDDTDMLMMELVPIAEFLHYLHLRFQFLRWDASAEPAADLAAHAPAFFEVVFRIAFVGERDERRGIERGEEQRRVAELRGVLLDFQLLTSKSGGDEPHVLYAVYPFSFMCRMAQLVLSFYWDRYLFPITLYICLFPFANSAVYGFQ